VYPLVAWPNADATKRTARDEVVTATCRVETGRLGNAARTLQNSDRVAIASEEVIQTLRDQHIQGDPHPLGDDLAFASASIPTEEAIRAALDSFVREVSPGLSGWTVSLLKIALRTDPFLKFLQHLTAAIAKGTAPGQRLLCAARLTPIDKADGGIRPIACGDLIYRFLCMKAILSANFSSDFLLPNQLGVLSKGGIEPIARCIQRAVDGDLGDRSRTSPSWISRTPLTLCRDPTRQMESDDSLPLCTRPPNGHTIRPPTYSFERHHKPQSAFCLPRVSAKATLSVL